MITAYLFSNIILEALVFWQIHFKFNTCYDLDKQSCQLDATFSYTIIYPSVTYTIDIKKSLLNIGI